MVTAVMNMERIQSQQAQVSLMNLSVAFFLASYIFG
jgi:hypothetical protein